MKNKTLKSAINRLASEGFTIGVMVHGFFDLVAFTPFSNIIFVRVIETERNENIDSYVRLVADATTPIRDCFKMLLVRRRGIKANDPGRFERYVFESQSSAQLGQVTWQNRQVKSQDKLR